jgi:N utilization substance protein B
MGVRRKGRESALQVLYLLDGNPELSADEALARYWELSRGAPEREHLLRTGDDAREFCEKLVRGAVERRDEIDALIRRHSPNWRLERMSMVDRNVLRLAVFELTECPEIPAGVTLNEAIELARHYGTAESGAFVNGILDRVAADARRT